ncbi:cytochrome c oxidase subunit 4 [Streptomyces sp. A73]|uniref:aa3-type cytochrome oxidase subunit IV n=1 Tax=Streptomyces sp. RK75 TaxID=2824895 RepID=UPI000C17A817|nr:cytochrome c oxidase subunit 4 [Streptomyces sp. RK75]MBQ0862737.1 cytochrome c oxidase subunit 4 [Streptomyces sp. RK75]MBQ1158258.1 cytochrome c oxidase subunit 4 [Streptomyces sp. A73]
MKLEAILFAGVALFFACVTIPYALYGDDPAGTAAVLIACLMASLVSFFLMVQYKRRGIRPEDRRGGEIHERGGPMGFFPAGSPYPVLTALGVAVLGTGTVFGLWLALIGAGVTGAGVFGFVFQYAQTDR